MITLKKSGIVLKYNEANGSIESLINDGCEYVGEKTVIFRIALRDTEGEIEYAELDQMKFIGCEECDWSFNATYEGCNLEVIVSAEITEHIEWKITISQTDSRVLEWVNFPQIAVPYDLKDRGGKSKILWGFNEGGIVDDLSYKEGDGFRYREPQYPSQGTIPLYPGIVESQFLAYYDGTKGLYFGAHDKEDHLKGIDFYQYRDGIMLQFRHFCGAYAGEGYKMNFPMVMDFFKGEWQGAAQIYKDWFKENRKDEFIPILKNTSLPDWYSESPVIITYPVRGHHDGDIMNPNKMFPYCNAMEHVDRLEKELNSKIMIILMHWEGTAPWAPPYVWPPYGGEEELKKFIDALHERGDVFGVYCSGIGWTQYSKLVDNYNREEEYEKKNLKEIMCLSPKQELPYSRIVAFTRAGYDMCPSQRFVTDVLKEQVRYMVDAGIDYIQLLDQNHGGTSYFCYSKKHGHPPVPGKWQVDAMKKMLTEIKKDCGKVLLGCESAAAEGYLPYLLFNDNRFQLNYGAGVPVPVYAYLYHEYINNFMGNQVVANGFLDHKQSPENILERIAYAFAAGDMMTLILNDEGNITWNWGWRELDDIPNQENIKTFVRNANMWRQGIGKKYLHTGSMVSPFEVECEKNTIHGKGDYVFHIDKIHTSAWMAEEERFAQFLINYNTEETECMISLPEGSYRLYEDEEHFEILTGGKQKIKIKRLAVMMLEKATDI